MRGVGGRRVIFCCRVGAIKRAGGAIELQISHLMDVAHGCDRVIRATS